MRDAAQDLASTLRDLKFTRGIACPCVWQGCIKGKHIVATLHGVDITIGGERSVVGFLIKMRSRKFEIKNHEIGEDPDLEKSGRMLNRVIEWDRDGITIEADQRHVREKRDILSWNEQITQRLHAPWKERMRAAQKKLKARERTDADRDRPRPSTIGTS